MYLLYLQFNAEKELRYIEVPGCIIFNLFLKVGVATSMIRLDLIFDKK